jgi:predicted membrane-bound spermidine synthase
MGCLPTALFTQKARRTNELLSREGKTGHALFLNGNLQFNSFDEYRYHEALVHPAFAAFNGEPKRVLVLGGVTDSPCGRS